MPGKTNQFTSDYGKEFPEPIRFVVNEKLQKLEDTGAFSSGLSSDDIATLITSHVWSRNVPDSDTVTTITFNADETGYMLLSDGDRFELTWKVKDLQVDIAMTLPQGVGYASYDIVSTGDSYQLIQTDDTSFVYDMK